MGIRHPQKTHLARGRSLESDRSRLDSVDTMPRLVDDDTSSGEESESEDESRQAGITIDSARAQWKPTGKSVCALLTPPHAL